MIFWSGAILMIVTYASVTSALPPCVCTRELKPVCGTDGETYHNMCLLRCQQESHPSLQLQNHGPCRSARDTGNEEPCICTLEYAPVCGSDGRTYPNRCAMGCGDNRGKVEFVHEGDCDTDTQVAAEKLCACPLNLLPVCGTDGKTYGNLCTLKCEGVEVAHYGACKAKRETCACPYIIAPVCGTNGRTYDNECLLHCENDVEVGHSGACKTLSETCPCPDITVPVCGTDGKTYVNECAPSCSGVNVQHSGACKAKRETCACPYIIAPVCGTDGKTYDNECSLYCENGVEVAHQGACKAKREACICPYMYLPVCGTDGKTYGNECSLKCQNGVRVAHTGACRAKREVENEPPACFCTFENDPVCGTNGRTYDNMCALECEGDKVQLAYKGDCRAKRESVQIADLPPCVCTREAKPVCGTDGKTYSNPCMLNCVREQNEDLHIDYPGICRDQVKVRDVNPQPTCTCPRNMRPVCASNGRTYNNECLLRCAGADLTVASDGPCQDEQ